MGLAVDVGSAVAVGLDVDVGLAVEVGWAVDPVGDGPETNATMGAHAS